MPTFSVHTNNEPVMRLDLVAQSWIYIGKLWEHRNSARGREIIRAHVAMIRRWKS